MVSLGGAAGAKCATTVLAPLATRLQTGVVPVQSPDQATKAEPANGVAVRVRAVFLSNACEQSAPHAIPGTSDATRPAPVPSLPTERIAFAMQNDRLPEGR